MDEPTEMVTIRLRADAVADLAAKIAAFAAEAGNQAVSPLEMVAAAAAAAVLVEIHMVAESPSGPTENNRAVGRAAFDRGVQYGRENGYLVPTGAAEVAGGRA